MRRRRINLRDETRPEPRTGARMVLYGEELFLFGGQDVNSVTLADFWKFSLEQKAWTKIQASGEAPSPCSGHTMTVVNDNLVMFGGLVAITKECNDVLRYNFAANTWSKILAPPKSSSPSPENSKSALAVTPHRSRSGSKASRRSCAPLSRSNLTTRFAAPDQDTTKSAPGFSRFRLANRAGRNELLPGLSDD
jgi:N-acetylneuraminic acid mutarotase